MIEFLGKFHPLLVHLPIGFLLLLGVLEWLALRPGGKELAAANRIILLLSIPATVASAGCGWLLAESGKYDASPCSGIAGSASPWPGPWFCFGSFANAVG
jgi:hypothetical protein